MQGSHTNAVRTASGIDENIFAILIPVGRLNHAKAVSAEEALDSSPIAISKVISGMPFVYCHTDHTYPQPIVAACSCVRVPSGTFQQRSYVAFTYSAYAPRSV